MSNSNRKIRKDSFEARHDMDFICNILRYLYLSKKLSTNQIPKIMFDDYNVEISPIRCYKIIKNMKIMRSQSEAVSLATSTLDYGVKILNPELLFIIDGITIGDGYIAPNHNTKVARLSITSSQKEFVSYCKKLMLPYLPSDEKYNVGKKGNGTWSFVTKHHPDLYEMYKRWYPNGKKEVPQDINLDKITVLLWYLGDGSLSSLKYGNSRILSFATNCFNRNSLNILAEKFKLLDIDVSRITTDNRMIIRTSSIVKILDYMGGESPVKCYSYKFDIEEWRRKKTMKNVSKELNVDYNKLANWVKTGFVRHSRSPGGKKVLFSDEEFLELQKRLNSGDLPREKHGRAKSVFIEKTDDILNSKFIKRHSESDDIFYNRVVNSCYEHGFPYKIWNDEKLLKEWYGLRKSQYIIPENNLIKWRVEGLSFADYFHPHIFLLNCKNKKSPMDVFKDRDFFMCCLKKYINFGGVLTYVGIYNAICRNIDSKRLNNFSPLVARDIYNYYCKDGYKVLDPCAGFSGRLIGASISKINNLEYVGIEPSLKIFNGLINTKNFVEKIEGVIFKSNIVNGCAEYCLKEYKDNLFDFCFTSPPRFDSEHYSQEVTQSYLKYPKYETWKNDFLKAMMSEIYRVVKPDKYVIINIGKSGKYDVPSDLINIVKEIGFVLEEVKNIVFSKYKFINFGTSKRFEPLMVLKKT